MSGAKVIEVSATGKTGFEDAINEGIARACDTVANVRITAYRVNMQVTFVIGDE